MAASVLPTRERMNPSRPEKAFYFSEDQWAYVLRDEGGRVRLVTSYGHLGAAWALGTFHELVHDQTLRPLGRFEILGIRDFKTGLSVGTIPDRSLPQWVCK